MRVEKTGEFRDWIDGLRDVAGRVRILMRIDRLIHANPGTLLLLIGGDKSTQSKDIAKAILLAQTFGD